MRSHLLSTPRYEAERPAGDRLWAALDEPRHTRHANDVRNANAVPVGLVSYDVTCA